MIIADGHVTRSVETGYGQLSPQEQNTINAIAKARLSSFGTLLIFYASGDEPWDVMHNYDNNIPSQAFDNSLVGNKTEELIQFLELVLIITECSLCLWNKKDLAFRC